MEFYTELSAIELEILKKNILRTILYYDIFSHPLKSDEIFTFLPQNSVTSETVESVLNELTSDSAGSLAEKQGYFYIKPKDENVDLRKEKEEYSLKMWKRANWVTHIIKRFPFVRCVIISGTLSKNSSDRSSDLDFMIITKSKRLWISRTLLMLFKKLFLFNNKKYFCLNYFITEDSMEIEVRNIYTAIEIATLKAIFNKPLLDDFISKNMWIKEYFPNYDPDDPKLHCGSAYCGSRTSFLQRFFELFFAGKFGDKLDNYLNRKTIGHWNRKYHHLEEDERNFRLKSTSTESKVHPNSVQKIILDLYAEKLKQFGL